MDMRLLAEVQTQLQLLQPSVEWNYKIAISSICSAISSPGVSQSAVEVPSSTGFLRLDQC